jgi:hypothetical protein
MLPKMGEEKTSGTIWISSHESNALIFQCTRTPLEKPTATSAVQVSGVVEMMILGSPWKQCSRTSAEEKSPE